MGRPLEDELARLDPQARILELEHEVRLLRGILNNELPYAAARQFAADLIRLGYCA